MNPRALILIAVVALYWVGIFTLTHIPADKLPQVSDDKTAHVVVYFVLAALLFWTMHALTQLPTTVIVARVLILTLAYAAFDELTQPLVGRFCDRWDFIADALGAIAAVVISIPIRIWLLVRPKKSATVPQLLSS